jgi:predicted aminopeptidase
MKRIALALATILALTGCESLSYYMQAVGGQLDLNTRSRPVGELLSDTHTPADLRARLLVAQSVREFASRELGLPDNKSYRSYAELDRPYVVWNVVIAPAYALEALESCFPVAGCVMYRGFFSREEAERYAAGATARGDDAFVYGVPAYSTLGAFDDPLLSTFIRWGDTELARLLFHELAHQILYVPGDSTFNESFAVLVEREGVRRWLAAEGRSAELSKYLDARAREREFAQRLEQTRARLKALYASGMPKDQMRAAKKAEYEQLAADPIYKRHAGGYVGGPNNALLASFATYSQLVPAFERHLAAAGGNLRLFYTRMKALSRLNKAERTRQLETQVNAMSTTER